MRICFGGASGKGFVASSESVPSSPCSSFHTRGTIHGSESGSDIAANHPCQSSRKWYGLIQQGRRFTSVGLHLNSYASHVCPSLEPSTGSSSRSRPTLPNAP